MIALNALELHYLALLRAFGCVSKRMKAEVEAYDEVHIYVTMLVNAW